MSVFHGLHVASSFAPDSVGGGPDSQTGRRVSAERKASRAVASLILRSAAAVGSLGQVAKRLGISATAVENWANPDHDAALTLGDLLAMPAPVAEAALVAALAYVQARKMDRSARLAPTERVLRLSGTASQVIGECMAALRDGRIDDGEKHSIRLLLTDLESEIGATRRDLDAA